MLKDPHDSRRKDELIMGSSVLIHINDRCDEVKGKVDGKILHQKKKKTSTRLSDGVIVRQWCKSECHHHVKESQAFCKTRAWGVELTTPNRRSPIKMREKVVSRHAPETLTAKVVRMCYPRDMQYLGYKIQSNYNMCTSECRNKLRHKGIDVVYVGVELLNKHNGTTHEFLIEKFSSLSSNDIGQHNVGEI